MADKLPVPLRDWILIRREKKGGSLILPDSSQVSFDFYAEAIGEAVEGIKPGDRLALRPAVMNQGVPLEGDYALLPEGSVIGVYR